MAYYLRDREYAHTDGPSSSEGAGGDVAAMPVVVEQEPPWLRGFVAQRAAAVGQAVAEQRRRGVGRRRPPGRVGRLLAPSSGDEEDDEDGYASPAGSVASIASHASRASRSLQGSPAPHRPEGTSCPGPARPEWPSSTPRTRASRPAGTGARSGALRAVRAEEGAQMQVRRGNGQQSAGLPGGARGVHGRSTGARARPAGPSH